MIFMSTIIQKLDMKDDLIFNSYTDAKNLKEENKNIVDIF